MTGIDLPEDIIENIFSRLPVKTLIRFTCLSKKYHHLILKDPVFAKTQYKFASRHRLLISDPDLGSLDLDTPSFDDIRNDIRKPNFRFLPPNSGKYDIIPSSLGSCNGLMFVLVQGFFVCNPSTGFFKKLPFGGYHTYAGHYHGVGYLSTTDDYKVVGNHMVVDEEMSVTAQWVEIFSLRAKVWKRMKKPSLLIEGEGTFSNEALHWIHQAAHHEMVVFDLAKEEFRTRQLPDFDQDGAHFRRIGVTARGSLCVLCYPEAACCDSLDFWIMREHEVDDSWSKLFNLKLADHEQQKLFDTWTEFLVMKSYTVAIGTGENRIINFVRIDHKGGKLDLCNIEGWYSEYLVRATKYEESLIWIDEAPDDPILLEREPAIERREREREIEREKREREMKRKKKRRRRVHGWTVRPKKKT